MKIRFRNQNKSLDQRVKRLELTNALLAISVFVLVIGFFIYSFRMRFIISDIISNIDGVIAIISDVSDQIQAFDNSFRAVSKIFGEFNEAFLGFREILFELNKILR